MERGWKAEVRKRNEKRIPEAEIGVEKKERHHGFRLFKHSSLIIPPSYS
jgi:hypothetical protein